MNMIEYRNVTKIYEDKTAALKNISLTIKRRVCFPVGPSSSGNNNDKTAYTGDSSFSGAIFVAGRNICNLAVPNSATSKEHRLRFSGFQLSIKLFLKMSHSRLK